MGIKVECFAGKPGWYFKMHFPHVASEAYLKYNFWKRRRQSVKYINWFMAQKDIPKPRIIEIETINRCNNTCSFCPANRTDDRRPFAKMERDVFEKIIADLKAWNYKGYLSLYINNEPFIDNRIIDLHRYVKQELPDCKIKFFTNGLLMTKEKFLEIIPYIDYMTINNYGETMELHENVKEIYNYVKKNQDKFKDKNIKISIRYIHDILTNRAGSAPNKKATGGKIHEPCLFPFTDMAIFSDGRAGICCNDATEKTNLGNVEIESMQDIWEKDKEGRDSYFSIRKIMQTDRSRWKFCKACDTIDSGLRVKVSKKVVERTKK